MSKVISKVAGFVLGAAEIGIGIATGNVALIIQGGATIIAQAIVDLTQPKTPARQASEMTIQLGEQPRSMAVGEFYTPGSLVDGFDYGGKYGTDWEVLVIRLADERCHSLTGFFVNDEYNLYASDGPVGRYKGNLEIYFRANTSVDPLPSVVTTHGPGWTSSDIGQSGCDVIVAYKADKPDAKHPVWPGGRPHFGFVVKGGFRYDPRKDSTVSGGSGSHRFDDPTTWEWSENPIVNWYNFERGIYVDGDTSDLGGLLVGRGMTEEESPPDFIFAAANLCDEANACLSHEPKESSAGTTALFAQSQNGAWIIRYVNNDIEWWSAAARVPLAFDASAGSVLVGTIENMAVADDGTVYFAGTNSGGDRLLYVTPPGGDTTEVDSDAVSGFNGPTRAFDLADGTRKVFTGEPGAGYLDYGTNVATTDAGRDFGISTDKVSIYGVFQPTGSSNQFTIIDLTGPNGSHTLTGLVTRSGPSTAHICWTSADQLFVTMDGKFYIIETSGFTIAASGTAPWGTGELPIMPGQSSFWFGYDEYSLLDGSLIQTVNPLDWVSENSYTGKLYSPVSNSIWTAVQFQTHIRIRFLGGVRYRVAGPIYASQDYIDVEGMFAAAVGGIIVTREGSVEIEPAQGKSVVATFTDDDLIVGSKVSWNEGILPESSDEWLNTVVAKYVEPDQKWNSHDAPVVRDTADIIADGKPRESALPLRLVRDQNQALRIAELARRLGRLWGRATVTLGPRFCELEDGDWVNWQSDRRFGGDTKTFRIDAYSIDEKWQNTLTLREINSSVFDDFCDFSTDSSLPAPRLPPPVIGEPAGGDWSLAATTLVSAGASVPALEITGAVPTTENAEAVIVEYWKYDGVTDPTVDPDSIPWTAAGRYPPDTAKVDITGLIGGETYYVALSYVVSGETGDRLVLGPETIADLDVSGQVTPLVNALSWKIACRAKTTTTLPANTYANGTSGVGATLTGNSNGALSAQDGVTLVANDRLLVANEASGSHNGIYKLTQVGDGSHPYILTRATDADSGAELVCATVKISEGTAAADQEWQCTTNATITVGTTALTFAQATGYTDEQAQDAIGAMIDGSLNYVDATPLLQRSALTGDVTAAAGSNATTIANDAVTYAKMQNVSATSRILARKTAGAGDTEECTLSEILDFIGSAAQGDILYRGASAWARLAAGTSGQYLQTTGAGSNPLWSIPSVTGGAGWTTLLNAYDFSGGGAASTKEVDVTGYKEIMVMGDALVHANTVFRSVQVSVNGGSSWFTGGTDYQEQSTSGIGTNTEAFLMHATSTASGRNVGLIILDNAGQIPVNAHSVTRTIQITFRGSATAINRIRLVGIKSVGGVDPGNFTSGKLWVYGR